jgi:O-antigen/teichoic acid export membrane protein
MTDPISQSLPISPPEPQPPRSTMHHDLFWAYAASGARIISWAIVSAFVFRKGGKEEFGMLSLVRGTIGILNYTAVGLAPAMVRMLAEARQSDAADPAIPVQSGGTLDYHSPRQASYEQRVYASGMVLALMTFVVGLLLTFLYTHYFDTWHRVPSRLVFEMPRVVFVIGLGTLFRLLSDVPGAVLQTNGAIALDNRLLAVGEGFWIAITLVFGPRDPIGSASIAYALANLSILAMRGVAAARIRSGRGSWAVDAQMLWRLLALGSLVLIAQLADYLYAPTDYILIDHFLGAADVGAYAPAVQIDAGMLTLVTALSVVLLPKAALAHTSGSIGTVRRYYIRGTLASLAILAAGAVCVWLAAPWLLRLWLGADPGTTVILPLVLIHTVVGGSSAVGRSILLAMGKFKPFTASVLIAGATNVIASYCFVKYLHWGLRGIVLGTIVAVVGRCALWMPWYVMSVTRGQGAV